LCGLCGSGNFKTNVASSSPGCDVSVYTRDPPRGSPITPGTLIDTYWPLTKSIGRSDRKVYSQIVGASSWRSTKLRCMDTSIAQRCHAELVSASKRGCSVWVGPRRLGPEM